MDALRLRPQAADRPTRPTERRASGEFCNGPLRPRDERRASTSGASRSARTSCWSTPLQMAMVAAAVANGGVLMQPAPRRRGSSTPTGRTTMQHRARRRPSRVMTPATADEGHGDDDAASSRREPARPPRSRASTSPARPAPPRRRRAGDINQPGSSASRPATTRRSPIAVTIERSVGGFGGTDRRADRQGRDGGAAADERATSTPDTVVDGRYRVDAPARLGRDGRRLPAPRTCSSGARSR